MGFRMEPLCLAAFFLPNLIGGMTHSGPSTTTATAKQETQKQKLIFVSGFWLSTDNSNSYYVKSTWKLLFWLVIKYEIR